MDRLTLITLAAHQPRRAIAFKANTYLRWCAACLSAHSNMDTRLAAVASTSPFTGLVCAFCDVELEFYDIKPSLTEPTP